jgi:anaerobic selenocysteine-containing dehydrogenase
VAGATYTFGGSFNVDAGPETRLLLFWGSDPLFLMGGERKEAFRSAILAGAKLMVINPKKIDSAKRADLWMGLRPQSDGVLALGIAKVMIEEKLYDEAFAAKWTVGFEELEKHVKTFSLEEVERFTWIPQAQIKRAAHLFAENRPACFVVGNAVERGIHAFQQLRAIYILETLIGGLNVRGGNALMTPAPFVRMGRFFLLKGSPRKMEKGLCSPFKVGMASAYVPPQSLVRTILDEKPYPIKAALCILSNPLVSYPDTEETYKALMKLDFFVVSEIFPTPSTAVADIVLPAAWQGEHDTVGYWPGWYGEIRAYPKFVEPPGEARPDPEWINELAKRMGLKDYFWRDWKECLNHILEPSGLSWESFKEKRVLRIEREYKEPEEGIFKTPSGKVEIYSERLKELGYSPMPLFEELSELCFKPTEEYPLLLFNGKEAAYMLTGYKHVAFARSLRPQPTVDLHPSVAERSGLKEGDWVYVETKKGRIKQILSLDPDLDPKLVFVSWGWWFPEDPADHYQFRKSNVNVLIPGEPPYDRETGSVEMGGIPCKVYKA